MKNRLRLGFGLVLACLLTAGHITAQDRITIIRERDMADPAFRASLLSYRGGDCDLGNPLPWDMCNALEVEDGYYLEQPAETCSCVPGLHVYELRHLFYVCNLLIPECEEAGGGFLSVHGELMEADWDPQIECWVPGQVLCSTPGMTLEVPVSCPECMELDNGFIDWIGDLSNCDCAFPGYPYFLHVHVEGGNPTTCTRHEMPFDDAPPQCAAAGEAHNVFLTGSADCCGIPIPAVEPTWGSIKSWFR